MDLELGFLVRLGQVRSKTLEKERVSKKVKKEILESSARRKLIHQLFQSSEGS